MENRAKAKYLSMLREESELPLEQWWLSFCDPNLPEGTQFLGAVCIDARGVADATHRVNMMGLNLGGEIMFVKIPDGKRVREDYCNRVLNKEEAYNAPAVDVEMNCAQN